MNFSGKRALVTGGSRGIGFHICKILLEHGVDVLAVSRNLNSLNDARGSLPELRILQGDVSIPVDNDAIATWVTENWGELDILINNAGISPAPAEKITSITDEVFEETFRVNVFGPYFCTKRLVPLLLKSNDPRVINVGSTMGIMTSELRGVYSVSKTALHSLTIAMANEFIGSISVNALSPGWVKTDMAPNAPGDPRESAEAAIWVLSQPSNVTGKLLRFQVELGWSS
jgi:NAD(P)-dependent dehydrogenase (short-subunit alcohol dehydrogenase family)